MVTDLGLLTKVKTYLRIGHTALDEDIGDHIAACLADLRMVGVQAPLPDDPQEMDPLILNAVKLYCKAQITDDTGKAGEFLNRYDALKSSLMMASEYNGEAVTNE